MKEKEFCVKFPIFNYLVFVIYSNDVKKSRISRNERLGVDDPPLNEHVRALHSYDHLHPNGFIFVNYNVSPGVLAHECFHALWRMFEWIGAKHDNETFAYHLGYLIDYVTIKSKIKSCKKN